ncbi:MAG TPA: tetratricopeptide repeat protein [Acidobacteriota bacterium]|nr:tetratricopeptide repeat protein [Acidobacteriota bacterium]HNT99088.1 tetratricopeptide repeat protein [Acidobacteriota bacterium]HPB27451.1 tetratricopeptide repeat protein [Acidobacteriota bacterium]HQO24726.1 tetratricopeptide repeat protein [Acidobacteriota bacterium]HQP73210.1 tetratricopeptide repeat protein [Acidobacteriota bacterium]
MTNSRILLGFILTMVLTGAARPADYPKPHRDSVTPNEAQAQLIRDGIALHDRGEYNKAIAKYNLVMAENPDCMPALHELCYSLFTAGRYADALRHARRGMEYRSDNLAGFYAVAGNCLDALDDPKGALKAYDAGIRLAPGEGLLYFNRAVTLLNQDKPGPAVDDIQRALYRKPGHPTSHLLLGQIWYQQDNRIPALLALLRFLELEPASGRSADALRIVTGMLNELVQIAGEGDEQKIEIALRAKTPKKEGDFTSLETALALALAAQSIGDAADQPKDARLLGTFDSFFTMMGETAGQVRGRFVPRFYMQYFAGLQEKDLVEPWLYHILQSTDLAGVRTWRSQNQVKLAYYEEWSRSYRWPGEK